MSEQIEAQAAQPAQSWCARCGTSHAQNGRCPGELLATGPERLAWRVHVEGPRGTEAYGVLVAPAGERWRARILTYPNILWAAPGGASMKFVADTWTDAEDQAVEYIRLHCRLRGLKMEKRPPKLESGAVDLEQDAPTASSPEVQAAQRELRTIPVRFGTSRPTESAATEDISEGGLFIVTESPASEGTELSMRIEIGGYGIPLRGVVRWIRSEADGGRSPGMGVELIRPHARYLHYVRAQRKAEDGVVPGPT